MSLTALRIENYQTINRGLWNIKKKQFIVPPDSPQDGKVVKLKEYLVSNQCYVIICGQTCESCFKIFQPKENVQITPLEATEASKAAVKTQIEPPNDNIETKSEGDMKTKLKSMKSEEEPLTKEPSIEKPSDDKAKPKRSSNKSLVPVADSQPKKSKSKASKRSRSPSIVVLDSPVKEAPKKKNKNESKFDVKIKPVEKVQPKKELARHCYAQLLQK